MPSLDPAKLFVLDASVLVDGRATEAAAAGQFDGGTLVIHEAVMAELEVVARAGRETGVAGLTELGNLQRLAAEGRFGLRYEGERPRVQALSAPGQESAASSRRLAGGLAATLVTSDRLQRLACDAHGVAVSYLGTLRPDLDGLRLMAFFDAETMSVHLRAHSPPKAKKGAPGSMQIVTLDAQPMAERDVDATAREIVEAAEQHPDGFIEADAGGSTIVQLANLRIAIARPPFADALEITAVRPVTRLRLEDYEGYLLVKGRLQEHNRGILVAGAPGAGKSTFVQAVADWLEQSGWVIKTMERPRDLVVSDDITQYTALSGDMANTGDVLLLVRPDYTIFDEIRRTPDFLVFADLRLAGVGMVGVVHATRGIDALQRFVGRVELGMIPQVVDTVVFIDGGDVGEVLDLTLTVKMPTGLGDEGLARPVIEVRDHATQKLVFEVYTFGEQVVVMPVTDKAAAKAVWRLAAQAVTDELSRYVRGHLQVKFVADGKAEVHVEEEEVGLLVGRGGSRIREMEERLGIKLDVRAAEGPPAPAWSPRGGRRRRR